MQGNILKVSFLMSYLTMLICVVTGIPFLTSLFRSVILMALFSLTGLLLRWYLLKVVTSVEPSKIPGFAPEGEAAEELEQEPEPEPEAEAPELAENLENNE